MRFWVRKTLGNPFSPHPHPQINFLSILTENESGILLLKKTVLSALASKLNTGLINKG